MPSVCSGVIWLLASCNHLAHHLSKIKWQNSALHFVKNTITVNQVPVFSQPAQRQVVRCVSPLCPLILATSTTFKTAHTPRCVSPLEMVPFSISAATPRHFTQYVLYTVDRQTNTGFGGQGGFMHEHTTRKQWKILRKVNYNKELIFNHGPNDTRKSPGHISETSENTSFTH